MKDSNPEPIQIVSSLIMNSPKPKHHSQRFDSSTIQRVLDDKELSEIFDDKLRGSGVHTSIGYSAVLRQFLASDEVISKVKEWEDEKVKDDDTATTAATSWRNGIGGLASSFTSRLTLFDEEPQDPSTISPLTAKSTFLSPIANRAAFSDYGPTRTPKPSTSTSGVSPSKTFPSLPFTSRNDGFDDSPTFRKQLIEFMALPFNNIDLHLKDETVKPKKQIPKSQRNLQSKRRTSRRQADLAASIRLEDLSLGSDSEHGSIDGDQKHDHFECNTP
ncbi:hypothetical protein ACHAWO_009615 [Cyclotella atomus]|uniref:Uncharacterized protein n=1 Tax=Cyclotella atomus TaxID=382360 RepID=A0ABD3PIX8_9STRA